jgi:hypothetical protein
MPPGTRQYSRYVNGNPVTGTEGSIPPATAFDESQVEIIEVIQRAGIVPTHNDLTQLWQALMALFSQKYISSPITKTVHGVGADFSDLNAAMLWLGQYVILPTGYVTFMVAPGKWTYTTTVELNHPNLNRVAIQGGALLGGSPTPSNFSIGGYHLSSDGSNHIIYLRSVYATELSFTGGVNGFLSVRPGTTLRYLLITGSQTVGPVTPPYYQGNGIYATADLWIDGIAIWGFGTHGFAIDHAMVRCSSSLSITVSFCGSCGINNNGGAYSSWSNTSYTNLVSNATCGLNNLGGSQWLGKVYIAGHGPPNGNAAIQCLQGGLIAANPGSQCATNYAGIVCAGAATILFESSYINNCGQYGLYAYGNGMVWVNNCSFFGNGTYDVIATEGAMVDASGAGMGTAWTPPFNTYNINAGGFIVH